MVVSDAIGRVEAAAEVLAAPGGPPLVIGVSQTLYAGWLASRLPRFLSAHPEILLDIRSLVGGETPPRDAVFSISFGQPASGTDNIELFGESLVPVARPNIARGIRSPQDLLKHVLIEVADHRKNWAQVLNADFIPPETQKIHVDTTLAALSLANAGCGLALARPPASDDLVRVFGLVPCANITPIQGVERYHLVSYSGLVLSTDALRFKDWVLEEVKTDLRLSFQN